MMGAAIWFFGGIASLIVTGVTLSVLDGMGVFLRTVKHLDYRQVTRIKRSVSGYHTNDVTKKIGPEEAWEIVERIAKHIGSGNSPSNALYQNGLVFTTLSRKAIMPPHGHCFLGIDIDSKKGYTGCLFDLQHSIHFKDRSFVVFESSPDRYWIFVDYEDTFPRICSLLKCVWGVDKKWLELCEKRGYLVFRGFPRNPNYPRRIDKSILEEGRFKKWVQMLESHWGGEEMFYIKAYFSFDPEKETFTPAPASEEKGKQRKKKRHKSRSDLVDI